jgi:hypothetical protein
MSSVCDTKSFSCPSLAAEHSTDGRDPGWPVASVGECRGAGGGGQGDPLAAFDDTDVLCMRHQVILLCMMVSTLLVFRSCSTVGRIGGSVSRRWRRWPRMSRSARRSSRGTALNRLFVPSSCVFSTKLCEGTNSMCAFLIVAQYV